MRQAAGKRGVLCVGRVYCDLVFTGLPRLPTMGTEVFADGLTLHAGGGAAITAAYLAALGRPTFLWAHLPGPPFDAPVAAQLLRHGIDTRFCARGEEPQVTVAMAGADDRAFLTRQTGPVCPSLDEAEIAAVDIGHLHIGELRTLREVPSLIEAARGAGLTVSLDCGWDDAQTAASDLIGAVDVFLPNADEAAQLAALGLAERPAPVTVVKRGAKGARLLTVDLRLDAPARAARVVDTTGAGDAFNGGFLHGWLSGLEAAECLALGTACGAQAVGATGGMAGAAQLDFATAAQ